MERRKVLIGTNTVIKEELTRSKLSEDEKIIAKTSTNR